MKHRRILSGLAALMLAASLPMSALAKEWDIGDGDITIVAGNDGQKVSQGTENNVSDDNPIIIGNSTTNTVSIVAEKDQTANVTLGGANIDVSDKYMAAISTSGEGDVTIELDGNNEIKSGRNHAGLEKENKGSLAITDKDSNGALTAKGGDYGAGIGGGAYGDVSNITISGGKIKAIGGESGAGIGGNIHASGCNITIAGGEVTASGGRNGSGIGGGDQGGGVNITISGGNVLATGGDYAAGIGSGSGRDHSGSDITISGGNVTAKGGTTGAGIGGGLDGGCNDIAVSGDAQVKVQGDAGDDSWSGTGAGIGDGGNTFHADGAELTPDTSKLTANGKIEYYAPGADMDKDAPSQTVVGTYIPPQPAQEAEAPAQPAAPLYRVTDGDGKYVSYETTWRDGVLTITTEADWAVLTGRLSGIAALQTQGIEKIVFITNGVTSEFATADLLAAGAATDTYALTHQGEAVTFTLGETDVSGILG